MKKYILIILLIVVSSNILKATQRNDYSFDISPLIEKNTMFSVGITGALNEFNAWYNDDGRLVILDPYRQNTSRRDIYFRFMPYFQVRPIKFVELGVYSGFFYERRDTRDDIRGFTNKIDQFAFDNISFDAKVTLLDWYLSIGVKTGFSYNIASSELDPFASPINFYANIMLAGIPKVIPVNFILNYKFDTRNSVEDILRYGELIGAIEIITSPFITLYTGVSYVFPYNSSDTVTYVEPFVKFRANVGNFLSMTATFKKIAWGSGFVPNTATFNFSVEYLFYSPSWDWWDFSIKIKNKKDNIK